MTALVLDAGALIAVDWGDQDMHKLIQEALLAKTGDEVYTSDPGDLQRLCAATGFKAFVIGC